MLTRNVQLEGFDTNDWVRLAEVVRPHPDRPRERALDEAPDGSGRRGGIIAVTSGNRLRKLLATERGRLDPRAEPWPSALAELAERHGCKWALELHTGALDELMDRFGERLRPEHEMLDQALLLLGALRELESEGALVAWPYRLATWPVPNDRVLLRAFDAFCPDGKTLLLGVFEHGELLTCLAARRGGRGFDAIVGPDDLRREMGLVSGDWTRDYRHLVRATEQKLGPLAMGCFAELLTFKRLAAHPHPGAWAAAVASRDVVLSPVVPAVALPLGVDVGRAALATVRGLAERIGAGGWLGPDSPILPALERVRDLSLGDRDLSESLGFDPLSLLRRLLFREADD